MPRSSSRRETSTTRGSRAPSAGAGATCRSTIQSVPPARRIVSSLLRARSASMVVRPESDVARSNSWAGSSARLMRSRLADALAHGLADGLDDALVSGAAADVPRDGLADLALAGLAVRQEESLGGHQHSGRADAALRAALPDESRLKRRQALGG